MKRLPAFAIHLAISLLVFLAFFAIVYWFWYTQPYFTIEGGWTLLQMPFAINLLAGPLLTLIVFKPGKAGLTFDLVFIALVQLAALGYAGSVLYQRRPVYTVFAVDRFTAIPAQDIDSSLVGPESLQRHFDAGPLPAYVQSPADRKLAEKIMFEALQGGPDIDRHPELYQPYPPPLDQLTGRSFEPAALRSAGTASMQALDRFLREHGGDADDYLYFPLVGKISDVVLVLSAQTGMPAGYIDTDPWAIASRR